MSRSTEREWATRGSRLSLAEPTGVSKLPAWSSFDRSPPPCGRNPCKSATSPRVPNGSGYLGAETELPATEDRRSEAFLHCRRLATRPFVASDPFRKRPRGGPRPEREEPWHDPIPPGAREPTRFVRPTQSAGPKRGDAPPSAGPKMLWRSRFERSRAMISRYPVGP